MSVVSLIGGGWSFSAVDHTKVPGDVIAVNDTLLHLRRSIQYVVSMDRLWTENRWSHIEFRRLPTYLRKDTLKNVGWKTLPFVQAYENDRFETTFSNDITELRLNGRNSGACALNLAFRLRPKMLYLFGFDMHISVDQKAHWYMAYPWVAKGDKGGTGLRTYLEWASDFNHYAEQFKEAGIKVINVSPTSRITAFEKVSAEELGCAL